MKRGVLIPIALALMLIVALAPVAMAGPLDDTVIEATKRSIMMSSSSMAI